MACRLARRLAVVYKLLLCHKVELRTPGPHCGENWMMSSNALNTQVHFLLYRTVPIVQVYIVN